MRTTEILCFAMIVYVARAAVVHSDVEDPQNMLTNLMGKTKHLFDSVKNIDLMQSKAVFDATIGGNPLNALNNWIRSFIASRCEYLQIFLGPNCGIPQLSPPSLEKPIDKVQEAAGQVQKVAEKTVQDAVSKVQEVADNTMKNVQNTADTVQNTTKKILNSTTFPFQGLFGDTFNKKDENPKNGKDSPLGGLSIFKLNNNPRETKKSTDSNEASLETDQ